jgi:hypothetical protein
MALKDYNPIKYDVKPNYILTKPKYLGFYPIWSIGCAVGLIGFGLYIAMTPIRTAIRVNPYTVNKQELKEKHIFSR